MTLTPSTKLGSYEILSPLGAGGMGEVYRARDSKLGREVAIKVLPQEFTQHPQKLARFEREARLLASLNHPGIATLHGLETVKGKPFLVMELVEGETLAERIARGALPVEEALTLSQQISEALEAAHEKGVIHRDLKPANIKVDPEGKVKVLDFGLAKLAEAETDSDSLGEGGSASPTLSRDATRAGVILGTAAYMSPEQAKGKVVDKRTDIFSFGIVLFEMLTGKKAFAGEDVAEVLASVINREPDWGALPKDLDRRLAALLQRCLRKDRKLRRQSIGDVRVEIQEILAEPTAASETAQPRKQMLPWALMSIVSVVLLVSLWRPWQSEIPSETSVRISMQLGAGDHQLAPSDVRDGAMVVLSPDGKTLVFRQNRDTTGRDIGILRLEGESEPELLLQTPFDEDTGMLSPDDLWLAYVSNESGREEIYVRPFPGPGGKLQISTEGGAEPLWSRDGGELFYRIGDKMMAVAIATEPQLAPGRPTLLFEGRYRSGASGGNPATGYDVAPDGRFVMIRAEESAGTTQQINLVLNWFEELKRLVPSN